MNPTLLALKQFEQKMSLWQKTLHWFKPKQGWVRTLRKMLGMTTHQLAEHLGVDRSRVLKIEQAEIEDAVTLRTLRETANALHCELVYAFVPKESLSTILEKQAKKIAQRQIQNVSHSMSLENQSTSQKFQKEQLDILVKALLNGHRKHLWNDND